MESPEKVNLEHQVKVGEICLANRDEREKTMHRLLANTMFNLMWKKQCLHDSNNPMIGHFVNLL